MSDYVDKHSIFLKDKCHTPIHFPNSIPFALDYKSQKLDFNFLKTQLFLLEYMGAIMTDH